MRNSKAFRVYRYLGWAAAALALTVGIAELLFASDSLLRRAVFCGVLALCAVLILVGLRVVDMRPWPGAALVAVGAIDAGFPIFWTVLAPLLAITLVVLGVVVARGLSTASKLA